MKHLKKVLTAVCVLFTGFAATNAIQAQHKKTKTVPALLYEISGNGLAKNSFVFGTIHLVCAADMIPLEKLSRYIGETEKIYMEIDFDNPVELMSLTQLDSPKTKDSPVEFVTREQFNKIDELTQSVLGRPYDELKDLNPIVLQTMLITSKKSMGCGPLGSYELSILQYAMANKKEILGLETVKEQIDAVNKASGKSQANELYEFALNPEKVFKETRAIINAYKAQDSEAVFRQIETQMAKDLALQTALLDERNKKWIPTMEKAMNENSTFFAVGAGHLGGKAGVLKLLREKGYKLKPIRIE